MIRFSSGIERMMKRVIWMMPAPLAALVLAAMLLVSAPPEVASAVFVIPPVFSAPIQAAGLIETWTIGGWSGSTPFHLTSATVTFPAGFVIPAAPTVTVTANNVACTVMHVRVTEQTVAVVITGSCESSTPAPRQSITIAGITNPTTPATNAAAGFKLTTSADAEMAAAQGVVIWGMTATSLCYTFGEQSRAQVAFFTTGTTAANNTGSGITNALTFATTDGTFAVTPSLDPELGTPNQILSGTSSGTARVAVGTGGGARALVDVVVMPSSTTTARVTARVVPVGGGASILLASKDVSFMGGTCVPPVVVTPPASPAATGGTFSGGTIAQSGVSIVSFTGTTAQLGTASAASNLVSVTAAVGGAALTFVVGAPDFVNTQFTAAFPAGLNGVLVIVKA